MNPSAASGSSPDSRARRILALDALRLIAALVVVWQHFALVFELDQPAFLVWGLLDDKGPVTFFFVLSGYVLALSTQKEPISLGSYLRFGIRRVFRLYPLFWASLLLTLAVLLIIKKGGALAQVPSMPVSFLDGPNLDLKQWLLQASLLLPGIDSNFANPPVWTVMAEAKIAVLFPLLAWALLRSPFLIACTLLALLVLGSHWLDAHVMSTAALLGMFGLGAILARIPDCFWSSLSPGAWRMFLATSLVLYCMVSLRVALPSRWLAYYAGALGSAGLIVCAKHWRPFRQSLERLQRLARVDLSYGLYILHFPILAGILHLKQSMGLVLPWPAYFLVTLIMTTALSLGLHLVLEMPAIRLGRKLAARLQRSKPMSSEDGNDILPATTRT